MITKEFLVECLDILDLKYTELDNGQIAVSFYDEETFPYQIVTFISITDDTMISFSSRAFDYHPEGDLLMMANRHNCRSHTPACFIDSDGDVVMDRTFIIDAEVSPHYLLENVIKPSIFLPLDSFIYFELTDEEIEARRNQE